MVVQVLEVGSSIVVVVVQGVLQVVQVLALPVVVPYLHRDHLQVIRGQRSADSACGRCVVV